MNRIELKLQTSAPALFGKLNETTASVKLLLTQYVKNFPSYTDHSIEHTTEVFNIVDEILTDDELNNLNSDELYVLAMASYLHDIGMCIPEDKIASIADTEDLVRERELHPEIKREDYLRNIHHTLSAKFIREEWELLHIPSQKYAEAIALVSEGHRVVDIGSPEIYNPKFFVKNGREFVCLPYLSAILRIADELDITNVRTPKLLTKYYMPDNEKSVNEWNKHIVNTLRNVSENYVRFEVECSNYSMLASLEEQFNKIKSVINYCQKVIRNISNTEERKFNLKLEKVVEDYKYINFDPKGIKYSFDVDNVINAFVGENLYNDKLTSLREVIQNAIDTCRYKKVLNPDYMPDVEITISHDRIVISDNGMGMDEFIIKNFFGKLGSSFYQQQSVKKDYDGIGQFGVGVFSYFLMAEYIDIETKTSDSETQHFRLDQDPKNYFHFFKHHSRKSSGTTITLNLKPEFKDKTPEEYIKYIRDKFRFIEFTLKIKTANDTINIDGEQLNIEEVNKLLEDSLKHSFKNELREISHKAIKISNEQYDAYICFFYFNDFSFKSVFELLTEDNVLKDHTYFTAKYEISQKGIFVQNYYESILNDVYCKLNFKQKVIDIKINRNEFIGKQLKTFIQNINRKIIEEIFVEIQNKLDLNLLPKASYNFIEQCDKLNFSNKSIDDFEDVIYLKLFKKNKLIILQLKDFLNLNVEQFAISLNSAHLPDKIKNNYDYTLEFFVDDISIDSPMVYYALINLFNKYGYSEYLLEFEGHYYTKMKKNECPQKKWEDFIFIESSIEILPANILEIKRIDRYLLRDHNFRFNINHNYLKKLYSFTEKNTEMEPKTRSVIREILQSIRSYSRYNGIVEFGKFLISINALSDEVYKLTNLKYKFTKKDFMPTKQKSPASARLPYNKNI